MNRCGTAELQKFGHSTSPDPAFCAGVFPALARAGTRSLRDLGPFRGHDSQGRFEAAHVLCFKPACSLDRSIRTCVEPEDYEEWSRFIVRLVRHYKDRGAGIRYWEVANEQILASRAVAPIAFNRTAT